MAKNEDNICPVCKNIMVPYVGTNPHKQGTAFCNKCGIRRAVDEGTPKTEAETRQDAEVVSKAELKAEEKAAEAGATSPRKP